MIRKGPAPTGNRPSPKSTPADTRNYTTVPGHQRHEPPTDEDRADAAVLAAAAARRYKLAVPCSRCGQFLTAARSVALHLGPVCAAKMAVSA